MTALREASPLSFSWQNAPSHLAFISRMSSLKVSTSSNRAANPPPPHALPAPCPLPPHALIPFCSSPGEGAMPPSCAASRPAAISSCQRLCLSLRQTLDAPLLFSGWLLHLRLVAPPPLVALLLSSASCRAAASCRSLPAASTSRPQAGCCTTTSLPLAAPPLFFS